MATLVHTVIDSYNDIMINKSDPRVKDWFMMSSPFPTLFICIFYAYFAKSLGPRLMANRKPFELRRTMLYYNLVQVVISVFLFWESLAAGWGGQYSFRCQPVDYSNAPLAMRMARGCWLYYISKFIELTDTVFFVLRKKNNQVSTLHVIHHGSMPLSVWFGVKFTPGGHGSFFGLLNTFVHIWMYLYYFLAALGPAIQPYLWWKKYLTTMQMVQFVLVLLHEVQLVFIECDYPKAFVWWIAAHSIMFFFLFRNFYTQTYNAKKRGAKKSSDLKGSSDQNHDQPSQVRRQNANDKQQSTIYPNDYKMATGYISDEGLRNRVFIDNNRSAE